MNDYIKNFLAVLLCMFAIAAIAQFTDDMPAPRPIPGSLSDARRTIQINPTNYTIVFPPNATNLFRTNIHAVIAALEETGFSIDRVTSLTNVFTRAELPYGNDGFSWHIYTDENQDIVVWNPDSGAHFFFQTDGQFRTEGNLVSDSEVTANGTVRSLTGSLDSEGGLNINGGNAWLNAPTYIAAGRYLYINSDGNGLALAVPQTLSVRTNLANLATNVTFTFPYMMPSTNFGVALGTAFSLGSTTWWYSHKTTNSVLIHFSAAISGGGEATVTITDLDQPEH